MLVDFDTISDQSRIWIYSSDKKLTISHEKYILDYISAYIKDWESHAAPLTAGVKIFKNRFIVVALDDSLQLASGCSIDALQNKIQEIESSLSISLMNRLNIFYSSNEVIECVSVKKIVNHLTMDTLFYDLTIQRKHELSNWLKPIKEGWCKNLF